MVVASVRRFLHGIIDYAGIYPPASLPLDEAMERYLGYRQGGAAWMMSRFVVPALRLSELDKFREGFRERPPVPFSVIVRAPESDGSPELRTDIAAIRRFNVLHGPIVDASSIEIKASNVRHATGDHIADLAYQTQTELEALLVPVVVAYVEPSASALQGRTIHQILEGLAKHNRTTTGRLEAAFKIRCGSENASLIPSVEALAGVLRGCIDRGIRLKATAGLHHPVRRFDQRLNTQVHGFLNVFGAAILGVAQRLGEDTMASILNETDVTAFRFGADSFSWRNLSADIHEIESARRCFITSFGSCSFDEPVDDLRSIGLID